MSRFWLTPPLFALSLGCSEYSLHQPNEPLRSVETCPVESPEGWEPIPTVDASDRSRSAASSPRWSGAGPSMKPSQTTTV